MNRNHILAEIRRTAEANGGLPLGKQRFQKETGIREHDWRGKFWVNWNDAIKEAGYTPNRMVEAIDGSMLMEQLAGLVRELKRFPVVAEINMRARRQKEFPNYTVYSNRYGNKAAMCSALLNWCEANPGWNDVAAVCAPLAKAATEAEEESIPAEPAQAGYVYLLKSGNFYKIGRSNSPGRRQYELAIQLPESVSPVHVIATDDSSGIEDYWHKRFADRRKNGEWFELRREDVAAFRRRKFM